jgi:hypothetical protein
MISRRRRIATQNLQKRLGSEISGKSRMEMTEEVMAPEQRQGCKDQHKKYRQSVKLFEEVCNVFVGGR